MFICSECEKELPDTEYYFNKQGGRRHACKACVKIKNREKYNSDPELRKKRQERALRYAENEQWLIDRKTRSANFYKSMRGRAKTLFKGIERRSSKHPEDVDFDYTFILEKLEKGVCEVTGLPFDFDRVDDKFHNPYAPSVDRIDSSVGYTKDNTRVVIWQYNLMKGEISDEELLELCKVIINVSEKQNSSE